MCKLVFTDLPNPVVYMFQDGGCFYFTNFDEGRCNLDSHNPLVMYLNTGIDPSFDQVELCESLRREVVAYMGSLGFMVSE